MITRRQIRIKVVQAFYAQITGGNSAQDVFNQLLQPDYAALKADKRNPTAADEYTPAEDAQFLSELFLGTIKYNDAYEKIIAQNLQNWELSRVAVLDRIILSLAIHEMITFEDIPVKVTINEYLDIAKQYSTDKSSQFVNGVLDAVFQKLKQEGKIRKTGKGLLDPSPNDPLQALNP
jgi:N utilization substance protein B